MNRTAWSTRAVVIIVSILLLAISVACNRGGSEDVLAKVNGRKILGSEVEKYYKNQIAGSPQQPTDEQARSLRLNILRDLIDSQILMQRAEKLGLLATDEEIEAKLNEIKAPYTQEQFEKQLKERNMTADDLRRDLRRTLTVEKLLNREITSKINVSDSEINDYYSAHKAEFNLVEPQYHLAHILVSNQPAPQGANIRDKATNDADARKKMQMILNRLDSGEDFGTVAMRYSEDPQTAPSGGDLGLIPESGLQGTDAPTREAVAKLRPGQYSQIIQVVNPQNHQVYGYRVVKLIAKQPAGQRDVSDPRVQQFIREQLRERREQLLKAAFYEVLRNQAKVQNYLAEQILNSEGAKQGK